MYKFSLKSKKKLETCHQLLQDLMNEVIKHIDITILCGHRSRGEQNAAYYSRPQRSKLKYPKSFHNKTPSLAIDVAPWDSQKKGIDWQDIVSFQQMGIIILDIAQKMNIKVEWGGNWESFRDYPHFQLLIDD